MTEIGVGVKELQELQELFRIFSGNSNRVRVSEIVMALRYAEGDAATKSLLIEFLELEARESKDATLDFEEFVQVVALGKRNSAEQGNVGSLENRKSVGLNAPIEIDYFQSETVDLEKVFRLYDVENKGVLTKEDLQRVMREVGEWISDDQLDDMMGRADSNKDSGISKEEFVSILTQKPL